MAAIPDHPALDPLATWLAQRRLRRRHRGLLARRPPRGPGLLMGVPNVADPRSVNEKFLWRKLLDHDPRFTIVSDKVAAKAWVASLGLGVEVPRLRWAGTDAGTIPPALLKEDVVVKASHGCAQNLFPRREGLSRREVVRRANAFLLVDHGRRHHEWGYFGVPRRLLVEDVVGEGAAVQDLKVFTFGPLALRLHHIVDRFTAIGAARWDAGPDGRPRRAEAPLPFAPDRLIDAPLPAVTARAVEIARAIGAGFDHMRVDFLTDGARLWLGELTAYNRGGSVDDCGDDPDAPMARAWDLRRTWFARTPQAEPWRERYRRALGRRLAAEAPPAPPPSL